MLTDSFLWKDRHQIRNPENRQI